MAYGRKKYSGRKAYSGRKSSTRAYKSGSRSSSKRSGGPATVRLVLVTEPAGAVSRPQIGLTSQPIQRRKF